MPYATTNDGVRLWYDDAGIGRPLVMIHGWGASPEFFHRNRDDLARELRVVRMAYRGHYKSDKPEWGHHIARYAKDVKDLLESLALQDVTLLGWSMGASIIWSYYELFGTEHLSSVILVDQTPRQYLEFGGQNWPWAQTGVYDHESLAVWMTRLELDANGLTNQVVTGGFPEGEQPTAEEFAFFGGQIEMTPWWVRAKLMSDHTTLDWRDVLPRMGIRTQVIVGRKNLIFPWQGPAYAAEVIPGAELVMFEDSGHMPFYHEAEKFNRVVLEFARRGAAPSDDRNA